MLPLLLQLASLTLPAVPATLGVAAVDLESGRTLVAARENESFPMGSVYKLPIAMAVLRHIDSGTLELAQPVTITPEQFAPGRSPIRDAAHGQAVTLRLEQLIEATLSDSDNSGADALQRVLGGSPAVNDYLKSIGVQGIRVDRTEQQIAADITSDGVAAYNTDPRDTATPRGMLDLLIAIHRRRDGLSAATHDLLISILTTSRNPRLIALGIPATAVLQHKSGNMPGVLNDTGLITSPDGRHHLALAVFTKQAQTSEDEPRRAAIREIARRLYEAATTPPTP